MSGTEDKEYYAQLARALECAALSPVESQASTLERLTGLRQLEKARKLPIQDAETLREQLELAWRTGGSGIRSFARTTGTTSEPKNIPLNRAYLASLHRTLTLTTASLLHTSGEWETLLCGKRVLLGSRPLVGQSPTGLPVGDISGMIMEMSAQAAKEHHIPSARELHIPDWRQKMELIAERARKQNVVSINGIPALTMSFTELMLDRYGVGTLTEIWPELRILISGAVALTDGFKRYIGETWTGGSRKIRFVDTYFASEGQFGLTYDDSWPGMVFNTFENFFQFSEGLDGRELLQLHELQTGKQYSIFVTTPGGLVNYRMGDRIEVLSTRPWTFRVAGREGEELSLTGEKITTAQVEAAWDQVTSTLRLANRDFAIWAEEGVQNHLVWAIPESLAGKITAAALDLALCERNTLYLEAKEFENVFGDAKLCVVADGTFSRYRERKLGNGQFKPRRLFRTQELFLAEYE